MVRLRLERHNPLVIRQALCRRHLRRHMKFGHDPAMGGNGLARRSFHLFGNHVLSKGRCEMFDSSRHQHTRWIETNFTVSPMSYPQSPALLLSTTAY